MDEAHAMMKSLEEEEEEFQLQKLFEQISGPMSKLPIDLIINILSRLPVKTLKKLSMFLKPFQNLINHPRFVLIQHTRAISSTTTSPSLLVSEYLGFNGHHRHFVIDHESVDSLVGNSIEALTPAVSKVNIRGYDYPLYILGSCNGLVLMASIGVDGTLYICNPITSDEMTLLPHHRINTDDMTRWLSGFGFDSRTNEYKVVSIFKKCRGERKFVANVFTLGSDVYWREVPELPYFFKGEEFCVCVAGALHWVGYKTKKEEEEEELIVSFQLGIEAFREISLPPGGSGVVHLGVFGGEHLFIAKSSSDHHNIEVWFLEESGVQASWAKRYSISRKTLNLYNQTGGSKFIYSIVECGFMRLLKNGEILWVHNNGFGYYNPKEATFRYVNILFHGKCQRPWTYMFPIAHVESLISPKDIARLKKRIPAVGVPATNNSSSSNASKRGQQQKLTKCGTCSSKRSKK